MCLQLNFIFCWNVISLFWLGLQPVDPKIEWPKRETKIMLEWQANKSQTGRLQTLFESCQKNCCSYFKHENLKIFLSFTLWKSTNTCLDVYHSDIKIKTFLLKNGLAFCSNFKVCVSTSKTWFGTEKEGRCFVIKPEKKWTKHKLLQDKQSFISKQRVMGPEDK